VRLRLRALSAIGERLRPAQVRPRRPQHQTVVVVETARKRECLVGFAVSPEGFQN
jgi:hypothetical protein